jgi:hypothetical protein
MIREPKIEKNIPMPPKHKGRERDDSFYKTWLKLKPGESIFYEFNGLDELYLQRKILIWKRRFLEEHKLNWEMSTRIVEGGVRIWRLE